ncbi:MAG: hypothetical protein K1X90_02300 [Candidatus Kapabacteria bacterium]|nr:hypothetical protein [Candidatus Kapabacteria bacterium]
MPLTIDSESPVRKQTPRWFIVGAMLAALIAVPMLLPGCGDDTVAPIAPAIPVGSWISDQQFTLGGAHRMLRTRLDIRSQTSATRTDSLFTRQGSDWMFDSLTVADLQFQGVADGYQRTLEIWHPAGAPADTTLSYWYLFRRGDSLFHYVGMRFAGGNPGLQGVWSNEPADTALLGGCLRLVFSADSVAISDCAENLATRSVHSYHANRDTLVIAGRSWYGTRYEVVPGWSLYVTGRATGGYRLVE